MAVQSYPRSVLGLVFFFPFLQEKCNPQSLSARLLLSGGWVVAQLN